MLLNSTVKISASSTTLLDDPVELEEFEEFEELEELVMDDD
jgi:hypothetical protein